jgi:phage shock protein PspC (stress-responsive transcriptional regulator)
VTSGAPAPLVRPRSDRMIAGVCAGLARRFGMKSGTMRLLFALNLNAISGEKRRI